MKQKKVQLAHIYRGQILLGYGVAVDGVNTEPACIPSITAVFSLDADMNENPVRIELSESDS